MRYHGTCTSTTWTLTPAGFRVYTASCHIPFTADLYVTVPWRVILLCSQLSRQSNLNVPCKKMQPVQSWTYETKSISQGILQDLHVVIAKKVLENKNDKHSSTSTLKIHPEHCHVRVSWSAIDDSPQVCQGMAVSLEYIITLEAQCCWIPIKRRAHTHFIRSCVISDVSAKCIRVVFSNSSVIQHFKLGDGVQTTWWNLHTVHSFHFLFCVNVAYSVTTLVIVTASSWLIFSWKVHNQSLARTLCACWT